VPSRINHVKLVTSKPEVVDAFLREVCDIPEGWPLGDASAAPLTPDAPLGPGGDLPPDAITERRHATDTNGYIAGDPSSRQFQILRGSEPAQFWAICISTRHIEEVYRKAQARGVPCSPITVVDWNERDDIRNFFCVVAGLMFEVVRVEPKAGRAAGATP
jgi:hypothetical protein